MNTAARAPLLPVLLTACMAACSSNHSPDSTMESETIRSRHRAMMAAENRRNLAATMALMAPDVILSVEGIPATVGLDAARSYWGAFFQRPFFDIHDRGTRSVVVSGSGDIAYDSGSSGVRFPLNGRSCEEPGKTLLIWRKIDRVWRVAVYSYNSDMARGARPCP